MNMKFENEIVIDADRDVVWHALDGLDDVPGWRPTEHRRPSFIAGTYAGKRSTAVVVNHLESVGEKQTRWVIFSNHRPRALFGLIGPFLRGPISRQTQSLMEHVKLTVETRLAESGG